MTAAAKATDYNPHQHLLNIALNALKNAKSWDAAKAATYAAVNNSPVLMDALFEREKDKVLNKLLTVAASLSGGAKQKTAQTQGDTRIHHGRPTSGMAGLANVVKLSLLDTFKVNGQSIGDVTPTEANAWAASRERDARFVKVLTYNLPPNDPIRKYRRPDEVDVMYAESQRAT